MMNDDFELGKFYFAIQEKEILGTICTLAERVKYLGGGKFLTRENAAKHKKDYKIIYDY